MIRRFLTRVLIVILIAACVYNWMQTRLLQAQVAALQMQAPPPKQILATRQAPRAHSRHYSLQGQWERLQNQADVRSTRRKVLSYVKLYF